jgi:hypothetical protein
LEDGNYIKSKQINNMIQPTKQELKTKIIELNELLRKEAKNIMYHQTLTENMRDKMIDEVKLNQVLVKKISSLEDTIKECNKSWWKKMFPKIF